MLNMFRCFFFFLSKTWSLFSIFSFFPQVNTIILSIDLHCFSSAVLIKFSFQIFCMRTVHYGVKIIRRKYAIHDW